MKIDTLYIFKTPLVKNIATLITGNAIALAIPVVIYPILSRIFDPQDYALFGLYFSLFTFLEIASAARYDLAIVIPEEDIDAAHLMIGAAFIAVAYSLLIFLLVLAFRDMLSRALNNSELSAWLLLMPLSLTLISISKLCNSWLIRVKKFKAASVNKASQKIGEGVSQLSVGLLTNGSGLIIGDIIGRFLNASFSLYQALKAGFSIRIINRDRIKFLLKVYSEFPKYGIVPSMLNSLGGMLPIFIISSYYTADISGSFNFSRFVLAVPFALVATGVSQVIMQHIAERKNRQEFISKEIRSLAIKLFLGSLVLLTPVFFFAPQLFAFFFGNKWEVAGQYTRILICSTSISFVTSSLSMLLIVLRKIKWLSVWQVMYFGVISVLWFFHELTILQFLQVMVALEIFLYIIYAWLIWMAVKAYDRDILMRQADV